MSNVIVTASIGYNAKTENRNKFFGYISDTLLRYVGSDGQIVFLYKNNKNETYLLNGTSTEDIRSFIYNLKNNLFKFHLISGFLLTLNV